MQCLREDHLDDLMCIAIDGSPLLQWDASGAIDLWWKKSRRQVSDKRATPRPSHSSASVIDLDNDLSDDKFNLEDWESFVYIYWWPGIEFF